LISDTPITYDYIRNEGQNGKIGERLMAIVAEGERGRIYLNPTLEDEAIAIGAIPKWRPETLLPNNPRDFKTPNYGMKGFGDLFTPRQLVALTTFSDLVSEVRERIRRDAVDAGLSDDGNGIDAGGVGAIGYAEAVGVYLAFAVDKGANYWSTLCSWHSGRDTITSTFGRQALPMVWDFAEGNPLSESSGNYLSGIEQAAQQICIAPAFPDGHASQMDAMMQILSSDKIISTDPPYYDNIGYADLSDFFYVWLRRSMRSLLPSLFETVEVPKSTELVAAPYRHGSRGLAEEFFLAGMFRAMLQLAQHAHPEFPVTIYYAFKQSETDGQGGVTSSTGWETFLGALINAGFEILGTLPIRTEYTGNLKKNISALASSIVLVCRTRPADAPTATRREFIAALKSELPAALLHLQRSNIAPVDLAQAAIGPGMAVYTRYERVLDAEGKPLTVRDALALINQTLDEVLAEQEGDFDADSRWALAWFEQFGFAEGEYGVAETLSKAKNTSVAGMVEAGVIASKGGKVRLLRPSELSSGWDPGTDGRLTVWESVHHLVRALDNGEAAAGELVRRLGARAETARELAYRLYMLCERKKRAAEALGYNALVQSWPEIARLAQSSGSRSSIQEALL
jgi:putative DNA methylase